MKMGTLLFAAVSGVVAAGSGIAAGEIAAALTNPAASPLVAVGGSIIDAAPPEVKEFAVRTVGTNDKPLLLAGIAVLLVVFAALVGVAGTRRTLWGVLGVGLFGIVGIAAALSRPTPQIVDVVPSLAAATTAGAVLLWLQSRRPRSTEPGSDDVGEVSRRRFLTAVTVAAASAAVLGAGSVVLRGMRAAVVARSRDTVRLPIPASSATPLPAGTAPGFYTPLNSFYRVDTALAVPQVDVADWRLTIRGLVDHPMELTFDDLLRRDLIERDITLNCVSNEVGGQYVGTVRWLGVPLAALLREAGVDRGADQLVSRSTDGMVIGTPVHTILDGRDAMLVIGMNGEPLLAEHGFPVRMLTPGLYGYVGACKWITDIELSTFDAVSPYWAQRGWATDAPVKTGSRIDRPLPFAKLAAGPVIIAGVAWAQHRGISAVEVQLDDGPWQQATLLPVPSTDTWVQWTLPWDATAGAHTVRARATDRTGDTQTEKRSAPFPSGATGWPTTALTVV